MPFDIIKNLKSNVVVIAINMLANKLNPYQDGKHADEFLDNYVTQNASERIQRKAVTDYMLLFLRGLWAESPDELMLRLKKEQLDIKDSTLSNSRKA